MMLRISALLCCFSMCLASCGDDDATDAGRQDVQEADVEAPPDVRGTDGDTPMDVGADTIVDAPRVDGGSSDGGPDGHSGGLKAFPTAEGFGKNATGGRGGDVYRVTNLDDSGSGSLRDALSVPGRTVLFEVAGYIEAQSTIPVADNITIAGQTAFRSGGQGITIRRGAANAGGPLLSSGTNIIVRHIRLRPGRRVEGDCCGDAWAAVGQSDLIFDHVSASYSSDEMFDFTESTDITIQNSILSEPLSEVSAPRAGGKTVMGYYTDRISMYRSLIASSSQRNPVFAPLNGSTATHVYEYVNCYGFNLGSFGLTTATNDSGAPIQMNIIGNRWHSSSNVPQSRRWIQLASQAMSLYFLSDDNFDTRFRTSEDGDVWQELTAITDDFASNFSVPQSTEYQTTTPHPLPLVSDGSTPMSGVDLWDALKDEFGASAFRDAADERVIDQIESDEAPDWTLGPLDEGDFGEAYSSLDSIAMVPQDGDGDGLPDAFEEVLGSDPNVADNNGDLNGDGYTNIEEYLNSL